MTIISTVIVAVMSIVMAVFAITCPMIAVMPLPAVVTTGMFVIDLTMLWQHDVVAGAVVSVRPVVMTA